MKRNQLTIALYLSLVFAGGLAVGAFGHHLWMVKSVSATAPVKRKGPEDFRRAYVAEMRQRLKLTDSQAKDLEAILDQTSRKHKAVRERSKPEMDQIAADQTSSIRALLSDVQKQQFEQMRAEREAKRKAERDAEKR